MSWVCPKLHRISRPSWSICVFVVRKWVLWLPEDGVGDERRWVPWSLWALWAVALCLSHGRKMWRLKASRWGTWDTVTCQVLKRSSLLYLFSAIAYSNINNRSNYDTPKDPLPSWASKRPCSLQILVQESHPQGSPPWPLTHGPITSPPGWPLSHTALVLGAVCICLVETLMDICVSH